MKLPATRLTWFLLLAASHALVFQVARTLAGHDSRPPETRTDPEPATHHVRERSPASIRVTDFPQAWEQLKSADLSRTDFHKTRDQLLKRWMARDLGAALDHFYGPDADAAIHFPPASDAFRLQIAAQPLAVFDWIHNGRFGSARQQVFSLWFSALREDHRDLIISSMDHMTLYERQWTVDALGNKANATDLANIRKMLGKWSPEKFDQDPAARFRTQSEYENHLGPMHAEYASRLMKVSWPDDPTLFDKESNPLILHELGKAWVGVEMGGEVDTERIAEAVNLSGEARNGALEQIFDLAEDRRSAGVIPTFEALQELDAHDELVSPPAIRAVGQAAWGTPQDRADLADWITGLNDPDAQAALIQPLAHVYWQKDPMVGLDWLESLPPGPARDKAADSAFRMHADSSEVAERARALISDPKPR